MRVFSTEAVWDKNEQKFMQMFSVNGVEVDGETYMIELEHEMHDNEEGVIAHNYGCNHDVVEDEHDEDCECPECEEKYKLIYLADAVKDIFENNLCPQHVFKLLLDIYDNAFDCGFGEGYDESQEDMKDFLES